MTTNSDNLSHARATAYQLLASVLQRGVTDEVIDDARNHPGLEFLAEMPGTEDDRLALHETVLGRGVFPMAGVFLNESGIAGDEIGQDIRKYIQSSGYTMEVTDTTVDHLIPLLDLLGHLTRAAQTEVQQAHVLDRYLLSWIPSMTFAVRRLGDPAYSEFFDLVLDLLVDHRASLQLAVATPSVETIPLHDESDSVKDLSERLAKAHYLGSFLSMTDIKRLGRAANVPGGFGGRAQTLGNLLRSGAGFDALQQIANDLIELLDKESDSHTQLAQKQPILQALLAPWIAKLANSSGEIMEIARKIQLATEE